MSLLIFFFLRTAISAAAAATIATNTTAPPAIKSRITPFVKIVAVVAVPVAIDVVEHIDPDDLVNIWVWSAFERTQTDVQSLWWKDVA